VIKVLVVEDSKTVQLALVEIFSSDPQIQVVGTAATGEEAVAAAGALRPDVITMDIKLPGIDGFEATRAIMANCPTPIVIVTGRLDPRDSATLFRVMEAGALMVLPKPAPVGHPGFEESAARLIRNIKLMSEIKVVRRGGKAAARPGPARPEPPPQLLPRVVAIGASAGGPPVLQQILSSLPASYGLPLIIVQHMTEGFTENFVSWLNQSSRLPVQLAGHGMPLVAGHAYVAPDGYHLEVAHGDRLALSGAPPDNGLRPAVSHLLRSVARVYGKAAVGVLLTGMGRDGAAELKFLRDQGGVTIVQDRESSVVFGMPGEALRLGAADHVLGPEEIVALLVRLAGGGDRG
jgi:two-component system chemotaxis response regulator CheB